MGELLIVLGLIAGVVWVARGRAPMDGGNGGGQLPFDPNKGDDQFGGDESGTAPIDDGSAPGDDEAGQGRQTGLLPPPPAPDERTWETWPYMTRDLGTVTDVVEPGYWYQTRSGSTLEGIARASINTGGAKNSTVIAEARRIVRANPTKATPPKSDYSRRYYPNGVLRLFPKFRPNPQTPPQTDEAGGAFPLVYIPAATDPVPGD